MKEFWNERYAQNEFAYGEQPNAYFKQALAKLKPGKLLLPAEGEGRNAVYAAQQGWEVYSFDWSIEAQKKAQALATKIQVAIDYFVGTAKDLNYQDSFFDAAALIYAHLPKAELKLLFEKLSMQLKPGGVLLFEGFSTDHLTFNSVNEKAGGPKKKELLFDLKTLKKELSHEFLFTYGEALEIELNEGLYHNGKSAVIRFRAEKR